MEYADRNAPFSTPDHWGPSQSGTELMTRPPASRLQLAGIAVSTAAGIVLGLIALTIAKIGHAAHAWIWVPFAVCEGFAVVAGVLALIALRQRHNVIARAEALVMTLEAEAVTNTSDFQWAQSSILRPEAKYSPAFSEQTTRRGARSEPSSQPPRKPSSQPPPRLTTQANRLLRKPRRKIRAGQEPSSQPPPEPSSQPPPEHRSRGYLNQARDVRDALVDSGDFEIAERLQEAILQLAPESEQRANP
jgi:hypothetical protein